LRVTRAIGMLCTHAPFSMTLVCCECREAWLLAEDAVAGTSLTQVWLHCIWLTLDAYLSTSTQHAGPVFALLLVTRMRRSSHFKMSAVWRPLNDIIWSVVVEEVFPDITIRVVKFVFPPGSVHGGDDFSSFSYFLEPVIMTWMFTGPAIATHHLLGVLALLATVPRLSNYRPFSLFFTPTAFCVAIRPSLPFSNSAILCFAYLVVIPAAVPDVEALLVTETRPRGGRVHPGAFSPTCDVFSCTTQLTIVTSTLNGVKYTDQGQTKYHHDTTYSYRTMHCYVSKMQIYV